MPQQVTFDILSTYCLLGKKKSHFYISYKWQGKQKPKIRSLYLFNNIHLNTKCFL